MSQFVVRSLLSAFILFTFAAASVAATAQTFSVLHTFTGGADGAWPIAGLIMDPAGNLYGVASAGGTGTCSYEPPNTACGTIYELKNHHGSWLFNPLYSFQGGSDGEAPVQSLTRGPNGTYYGTTLAGGQGKCNFIYVSNCGVVFNAGPAPQPPRTPLLKFGETVLYRFNGSDDGGNPWSSVVFDQAGNIFGTTTGGGAHGGGTVFELSPAGGGAYTESVLYSFCSQPSCTDGKGPYDGVILDSAGNLFGTTAYGGIGGGTVFELSPAGGGKYTETLVHSFGGFDGAGGQPEAGVAMDSAGNLYGNTYEGGSGGGGTVWELTPNGSNWNFSVLYSVPVQPGGASARVTLDSSGNLYETLPAAGAFRYGQVLELARSGNNWTYIDLYDFTYGRDGASPNGGVVLDSGGNLYGTARIGGGNGCGSGCGVIWEITR